MKKFTKADLRTGDIVEMRNGHLGFVFKEKDAIIYDQTSGFDYISSAFNDDFTDAEDDNRDMDIVRVYRGDEDTVLGFLNFRDDGYLVFKADDTPEIPKPEYEEKNPTPVERSTIFAMGYYGDRTLTDADVDTVLTGCSEFMRAEASIVCHKKFVRLPDSDCYVAYDPEKIKREHSRIVCEIPELGISVYDKCAFCRLDENGKEIGIQKEDMEFINKYIR
ncbi:MAG: hypothetical protein ACI4RM_06350 [Ruminococcus sp.]